MNPTQNRSHNSPETPARGILGLPMTSADRRLYALRDSGYTGWIDQDGYARTDAETTAWTKLMNTVQSGWLPADGGGYVLTEAGRQALANADTARQFRISAVLFGGARDLLATEGDGEPWFNWLSNRDAGEVESYGEHLRDVYLDQREAADAAEPVEQEAPGTAGRVLRSAALYLERYDWIQGAYYDATARVFTPAACLVGAIAMVCYGGPVDAPAQHFDDPGFLDFEEAVLHLDRYLLVEDGTESYEFNDARGRQATDVCRVLRDAASRPADELIDAIRAIDARNADMALLVDLLKPCGIWAEQESTESSDVDDDAEGNFVDCQFCGAPGGYPYCQGSYGGRMSCADVVAADDAEHAAQGGDLR